MMVNNKINRLLMNSRNLTLMTMLLLSLNVSGKNNNDSQNAGEAVVVEASIPQDTIEIVKQKNNYAEFQARQHKEFVEYKTRQHKEYEEYQARQRKEYEETIAKLREQFEGNEEQFKKYMLMKCIEYKKIIQQ